MLKEVQEGIPRVETKRKILSVAYDEGKGEPHPSLRIQSKEGLRIIPVYSVRESSHQQKIARCMTSGDVVVFEAAGVMGFMVAVNCDQSKKDNNWEKFWEVKRGRISTDKVPIMMLPEDQDKIVDFDELHSDYSDLKDPKKRQKFFGTLPFHAILPLRDDVKDINREAFVTEAGGSNKKPTVCLYFQGGDRVWENIAQLTKSINPDVQVHLGISSFNDHGEPPPYDFDELLTYIVVKQRMDFEFVVRDPIAARHGIRSSHTQIRLPLIGEQPHIIVVRKGPVSADTISKYTGYTVKISENAKFASRGDPEHVGLDDRVLAYLKEANS